MIAFDPETVDYARVEELRNAIFELCIQSGFHPQATRVEGSESVYQAPRIELSLKLLQTRKPTP